MERMKDILSEMARIRSIIAKVTSFGKSEFFDKKSIEHGLEISKGATRQPDEVVMTQPMKNLIESFGESSEIPTDAPLTKGEKWLFEAVTTILIKMGGPKVDRYNTGLPQLDFHHYITDCWMNLKENWRFILPDMVSEINDMIKTYSSPTKPTNKMADPLYRRAVELCFNELPEVKASHDIKAINIPFMTKHSNVGYPYFYNDRTIIPGTNKTGAEVTMSDAERLKDRVSELVKYNVSTEFARFQGKGRLIIAVSRIVNLVLNQLEAEEIASYKAKSSLFTGYNNDVVLRYVMTQMVDFCRTHGYVMWNIDYHRYDSHVSLEDIIVVGAISAVKCRTERSKELARWRAALMCQTLLVAGSLGEEVRLFGRIFSGFIDTNRAGGLINAIQMFRCLLDQDKTYVNDIYSKTFAPMLVMGDDNLVITKSDFSLSRLQKCMASLGYEVDDMTKISFGPAFLRYRLFTDPSGGEHFAYPWTRVLRSMLFKERTVGLGPFGLVRAMEQQLFKLYDYDEAFKIVVNIVAHFDSLKLGVDYSVDEINAGIKREDAEAKAKNPKRYSSTAEKLNDGDPSKARQFKQNGEFDETFCNAIHNKIKDCYDPDYLASAYGINLPPLKKLD